MNKEEVIELVDSEAIFYDGFDDAIIGVADRFGMPTVVAYDKAKVIDCLMKTFDVTLDEDEIAEGITIENKKYEMAIEWFDYNTIGAWLGDYTPVFITINLE